MDQEERVGEVLLHFKQEELLVLEAHTLIFVRWPCPRGTWCGPREHSQGCENEEQPPHEA